MKCRCRSKPVAAEDPSEAKVFSGYYLTRLEKTPWLSFILQGTKQDSNVSTLGGAAVAGRGEILGARAMITLPPGKDFYQSVSLGVDYKHFDQNVNLGTGQIQSPVSYYPISAAYTASWVGKKSTTELNAGVTLHLRGTGSSDEQFSNSRYKSDGSFIYIRGDFSHTHELPGEFQLYGKIQGQLSDQPLLSAEQFSGGGVGTARGYLESEVAGDNALFGSLELRTPNLFKVLPWLRNRGNEWRVYSFIDSGFLTLRNPLPDQESHFDLASIGSSVQLFDHYNGSIDLAMPLISQGQSSANGVRLNFRLWADF